MAPTGSKLTTTMIINIHFISVIDTFSLFTKQVLPQANHDCFATISTTLSDRFVLFLFLYTNRKTLIGKSIHGIGIIRRFRDKLNRVPMLNDFSVLIKAKKIHGDVFFRLVVFRWPGLMGMQSY